MSLPELFANLLNIGAALTKCTPLSTKLDRPLYRDLVILDYPFSYAISTISHGLANVPYAYSRCPAVASYSNVAPLCLVSPADALYQIWISHLHLS